MHRYTSKDVQEYTVIVSHDDASAGAIGYEIRYTNDCYEPSGGGGDPDDDDTEERFVPHAQ